MTSEIATKLFVVGVKTEEYPNSLDIVLVATVDRKYIWEQLKSEYKSVGNGEFVYKVLKEFPIEKAIALWSIYSGGDTSNGVCRSEAYDCWEEICQ